MIEVGDFIRTDNGIIAQVINPNYYMEAYIECKEGLIIRNTIVNHSKNITDLIKVGDVISYRINNISTTLETKGYIEGIVDIADNEMLQEIKENKDYCIKSILTREQFAQAEYKIEKGE